MPGPFDNVRASTKWHAIALAGFLALGTTAGVVADQEAGPPATDWELTLRARNSIWDDLAFKRLNLTVTIRQGVATLHGPVPSTAVAEQAKVRLRQVAGIRGVIDETYVPPVDEPLTQKMPHPVTSQHASVPSVSGTTAERPAESVVPLPPLSQAIVPSPPIVGATISPALPTIAAPQRPVTLAEQIDLIRSRDRRFAGIRVEVQNGRVILRGNVARPQDAWEFAELVQRIAGVTSITQGIGNSGQ